MEACSPFDLRLPRTFGNEQLHAFVSLGPSARLTLLPIKCKHRPFRMTATVPTPCKHTDTVTKATHENESGQSVFVTVIGSLMGGYDAVHQDSCQAAEKRVSADICRSHFATSPPSL